MGWFRRATGGDPAEHEKIARLESAERDLADLKVRASRAHNQLESRRSRNHWRESIEQMIQGAI